MKLLEGIKILDFTQVHGGSLATMVLADFGAEVIKVEEPSKGDPARQWAPMKNGQSGYFVSLNRGKKSVAVDLNTEEGKKVICDLIRQVDVIVENYKYGQMEKFGLSYENVKAIKPEIIYASLSGYGQTGPLKNHVGLGLLTQAASGLMERTGFADGSPVKAGTALGEHVGGTYLAMGILLALIEKEKSGVGQHIDISIMDSLYSILETVPVTYCMKGDVEPRLGNGDAAVTPYDTYHTNDGYIAVGISADSQWLKFCDAMRMEEAKNDKRYETNELRSANYENGLKAEIEEAMKRESKFEIQRKLRDAKLACGAVYSVEEAMNIEPIKSRNMIQKVYDKGMGEEVSVMGTVIKMQETPGSIDGGAPILGEHTREYLESLGYTEERISELAARDIVRFA